MSEIRKDFLDMSSRLRFGGNYEKTSITIHSTANEKSTAENERAWLDNINNKRNASWHYVIDEKSGAVIVEESINIYMQKKTGLLYAESALAQKLLSLMDCAVGFDTAENTLIIADRQHMINSAMQQQNMRKP